MNKVGDANVVISMLNGCVDKLNYVLVRAVDNPLIFSDYTQDAADLSMFIDELSNDILSGL